MLIIPLWEPEKSPSIKVTGTGRVSKVKTEGKVGTEDQNRSSSTAKGGGHMAVLLDCYLQGYSQNAHHKTSEI
jgi:hypothetical protein